MMRGGGVEGGGETGLIYLSNHICRDRQIWPYTMHGVSGDVTQE